MQLLNNRVSGAAIHGRAEPEPGAGPAGAGPQGAGAGGPPGALAVMEPESSSADVVVGRLVAGEWEDG